MPRRLGTGGSAEAARSALLVKAAGVVAGLLTMVLTARLLSPADRGQYVLLLTIVGFLTTMLGGIPSAAAQRMRATGDVTVLGAGPLRLAVKAGVPVSAMAGLAALVLIDEPAPGLLIGVSVLPTVLLQTASGLLVARGRVRVGNLTTLLGQVLLPALLLSAAVATHVGLTACAACWLTAQVLGACWALAFRPAGAANSPTAARLLRPAMVIGSIGVLSLLNYRIELLVLSAVASGSEVSYYNVASSSAEVVWIAGTAVTTAAMHRILSADASELSHVVARALRQLFLIAFALAVLVGLTSPWLLPHVLGHDYARAVPATEILLLGTTAFAGATLLGSYFTVGRQSSRWPLTTVVTAAVVTASGTVVLAPGRGATGAAMACAAGYATGMALLVTVFLRDSRLEATELLPRPSDVRRLVGAIRRQ